MVEKYSRETLKKAIDLGVADIGEYTYGAPHIYYFRQGNRFICGRYCSLGGESEIYLGGNHRPDWVTTYPFPAYPRDWPGVPRVAYARGKGDVVIGNDVWLGARVTVLSGVTIGDGAVIAAHSVVTKDVAPYAIVAGNPARQKGWRFDEETVRDLMRIAWWNWPKPRVERYLPLLLAGDIRAFVEKALAEDAAG